jgi:DnaK suppressor protein
VPEDADRLAGERAATLLRIAELTRAFDDMVTSAEGMSNDEEHDPEGATLGFERAQVAALLDAARLHLRDTEAAMERLHSGTYGRCSVCAKPIAPERLEALPSATTCVGCAQSGRRRLAR